MPKFFKNYQLVCAVAVLIGTIAGAGTFGLPFVMAQSGWGLGLFYLIILTGVVLLIHLAYGEVVLRTGQAHCLVGYAGQYLGPRAKIFTTLVAFVEYYGSLLAYIILGGEFLRIIFSRFFGGSADAWVLVFFILAALAVGGGLKLVSGSELLMTLALVGTVIILVVKSWPLVNAQNFITINWSNWLLPYGVVLFALSGSVAVPEMRQILKGQERKLKTAIFGVLTVFTSFIIIGLNLKNTYIEDYNLRGGLAFFLTCLIPLAAYLLGIKSFILVIGFVGAVAAGLDGILTVAIYLKAEKTGDRRPEYALRGARLLRLGLVFIFALGLGTTLISFFNK